MVETTPRWYDTDIGTYKVATIYIFGGNDKNQK